MAKFGTPIAASASPKQRMCDARFTAAVRVAIGWSHDFSAWPYPATYPPLGVSWRAILGRAAPPKGVQSTT